MKTVSSKRTRDSSPSERDPSATTRMPATLMAEVEAWATANDVTRSDAIRRLVEMGGTDEKRQTQVKATRAKELAANVIDNLGDGAASADDRASRKSRLLKGPEAFRRAAFAPPKARKG